jgi:DNA ligase-associated metallophosphoesterase
MSLNTKLAGEDMVLLPERGLFWERRAMLLIADWHVGKAATFRAAGIPVPEGDLEEEFGRLEAMLGRTGADELVLLGDLVHAGSGLTEATIKRLQTWVSSCGVRVALVEGNHDRSAGIARVARLGLEMLGIESRQEPFVLQHEPSDSERGYVLAGHLHPTVRLGEGKRGGLSAPCFWFGENCGVLPAFGGFTGGRRIGGRAGDRVFAVGGGEVIEVPV